jgi:hypothetical protein
MYEYFQEVAIDGRLRGGLDPRGLGRADARSSNRSTTRSSAATPARPSSTRPCARSSSRSDRCWPSTPSSPSTRSSSASASPSARSSSGCRGRTTGRGPHQPRLPRRVQQRARPVQGRAALPPVGQPRDREVPRLRADLQERADRHADRRRQGRLGLRPEGPLRRRDHALLPELHDRAVPPPRRVHRRARRRHRRRHARDRLPVRPVQAHHQPLRVRRADRQGHRVGRRARAHRGHRLRHRFFAERDARGPRRVARRASTCVVSGSGNVAIYAIEKLQQLGAKVVACSDSDGVVVTTPTASTSSCSSRSRRSSAAGSRDYAERAASATHRPGATSGTSRATSPCRARPRTSSRQGRRSWSPTAASRRRGRQHADHPRGGPGVPGGRARVRAGQGRQRRRRRHLGARDAAERQPRPWSFEHTEERLAEIMRDIHHTCHETAEEYGAAGQLRQRRQHRRLPAGRCVPSSSLPCCCSPSAAFVLWVWTLVDVIQVPATTGSAPGASSSGCS